jgi:hypothetical protein
MGLVGGLFGIAAGLIGALFGIGVAVATLALPLLIVAAIVLGFMKLLALG